MKTPQIHKFFSIILFFITFSLLSQEKEISPWSFGTGISNYLISGDLKSDKINFGTYIYVDKMISPTFGFELKLFQNKTSGKSQDFSDNYTILYTPEDLNNLYFTGNTKGLEFNILINFNGFNFKSFNPNKKLQFGATIGIGYQAYQSKLYNEINKELLINYPAENNTTKSVFYGIALRAKYQINKRFDLELRQNLNYNNEDHLDAAISNKQKAELFFVTQLGISYKLFRKKQIKPKKNNSDLDLKSITEKTFIDTDGDSVIDQFDKEPNTEKGAFVYANGVTIDSDKDGVPDHKDKCPLIFGKDKNGCKNATTKTPLKTEKIIPKKSKNEKIKDTAFFKKTIIKTETKRKKEKIKTPVPKKNKEVAPVKKITQTKKEKITKIKKEPAIQKKKEKQEDPEYIKEKRLIDDIIAKAKKKKEPKKITIKYPKNKTEVVKRYKQNPNFYKIKELNKKNIHYNIFELDNSVNLDEIPISPVYIGCENKPTEFDKKNCLYTSISRFSIDNFNKKNIKSNLPKGFYTIRALIVINDLGKAKVLKTIGDWNKDVIKEVERVITNLPLFKPGLLNNIPTPVKLSIKIPFEVE